MKKPKPTKPLTQKRLRFLLNYNAKTGKFCANGHKKGSPRKKGDIIKGYPDQKGTNTYLRVWIDNRLYYMHRLAWFYTYGKWPKLIDHINGDGKDNRLINLRLASHTQNHANSKRYCNNKTDYKGVSLLRGRYRATIKINKKQVELGTFDSPQEAYLAYVAKAKEVYNEFARFV